MIPIQAELLRLHVRGDLRFGGRPLYASIVEKARTMNLAGATVFGVDLGLGARRQVLDSESEYTSFELPVVVELVDAPDRIDELLEVLGPIGPGLFVTRESVRVFHYASHTTPADPDSDVRP